jgi:general secretion pathway protein L
MPNRTLALDVDRATLRAALVESTLRSHRVLGLYARARNGDLAADLRALAATHALRWDEVVSALPGDAVTHRILALPFRDRRRLDQTVPFELEAQLPLELDEAVVDYQVLGTADGETVVLAALAPKAVVRDHLETLAAAGIDPRVVGLAPLAALNVLRHGGAGLAGTAALVVAGRERTDVALLRDGRLAGLRTLSRGVDGEGGVAAVVRETRWSLLALAGGAPPAPFGLWLGGEAAGAPGLAAALEDALGVAPRGLETLPLAAVPPGLRREQAVFATSLGLALRERAADGGFGVDFRRGELAYHREREAVWRALARTGVLALVAVALLVTSFVVEGRRLRAERDRARAEVRTLFTAALPDVRTIVNEKAQLEAEIAALEKQRRTYGGLAPSAPRAIDVLRVLTVSAPPDVDLDLEELSLDGETLRLRGSTRAYEGVEALKRALATRPELRAVEAKDVRASVDGQRVAFRLSLTLAPLVAGETPAGTGGPAAAPGNAAP